MKELIAERHWILSLKEKGLRRRLCSLVSFHPPVRNRIKANPWRGRNSAPCFFYHKGVGGPPYPPRDEKNFLLGWHGFCSAFRHSFPKNLEKYFVKLNIFTCYKQILGSPETNDGHPNKENKRKLKPETPAPCQGCFGKS